MVLNEDDNNLIGRTTLRTLARFVLKELKKVNMKTNRKP